MFGNVTALGGWIYIGEVQGQKHAPGMPHNPRRRQGMLMLSKPCTPTLNSNANP